MDKYTIIGDPILSNEWDIFTTDENGNQVATDTGSMMNLGGNIHSLFGDSKVACAAINANTATGSAGAYDFWAIQTQIKNYQSQRIEDAWISNLNIDVICTLQNL